MLLRRVAAAVGAPSARVTLTVPVRFGTAAGAGAVGKGNFFAFFDLPKQPVVDGTLLQKRYHALQRQVHPDRENVNAKEQQQQQQQQQREPAAEEGGGAPCGGPVTRPAYHEELKSAAGSPHSSIDVSTYANAAYETLKDPFFRCRYLARLEKAGQMKNSGGATSDATPTPTPTSVALTPLEEEELIVEDDRRAMLTRVANPNRPLSEEFLMEMLMMNELIFGGDRDDANTLAQMKVLQADLKERNAQYFDDVNAAWQAQDLDAFFGLMEEWTYIHNALTHLNDRL